MIRPAVLLLLAARLAASPEPAGDADLAPLRAALDAPIAERPEKLPAAAAALPALFRTPVYYAAADAALTRGGPRDAELAQTLILGGGDPRYADLAADLRGRSLAAQGKHAEALQAVMPWLELPGGLPLKRDALGWAIESGDAAVAVKLYGRLDDRLSADDRAAFIARIADKLPGLAPDALRTYAAWGLTRHPGGALEEKLRAALAAAGQADPLAGLDDDARWARCERLAGARKADQAVAECTTAASGPDRRLVLLRWKRLAGDLDGAEAMLALSDWPAAMRPGLDLERADVLRDRGERAAARRLLESVGASPAGDAAARAQLTLYAQAETPDEQRRWLAAYVENPDRGKDWSQRALSLAADEFAAGRAAAAEEWALRISRLGKPSDDLVHGAWYLLARLSELRHDANAAKGWYEKLLSFDKYGYYGMLARRRMAAPALPPPPATPLFSPQPGSPAEAGDLLLLCGFTEWAADAYRQAGAAGRGKEALAWYLAGQYARAANAARAGVSDPYSGEADRFGRLEWMLTYPVAYADRVRPGEPGEDPLLTLALIRQESFFKADAISSAGAVGLMQLMPATAARVARQSGLAWSRDRLSEPDYNTALGRRYFLDLLAAFGEPAYALAGYNAGPGRVPQWRSTLGDADLDLFIERIPLKETRSYVRRILLNWQEYRRIYGDHARAVEADRSLREAPWRAGWPRAAEPAGAAASAAAR